MDNQRVGFSGLVTYEEIPWTNLDYVTTFVTGALILFVIYMLYQCFRYKRTAALASSSTGYRELPGGTYPRNPGGVRVGESYSRSGYSSSDYSSVPSNYPGRGRGNPSQSYGY